MNDIYNLRYSTAPASYLYFHISSSHTILLPQILRTYPSAPAGAACPNPLPDAAMTTLPPPTHFARLLGLTLLVLLGLLLYVSEGRA